MDYPYYCYDNSPSFVSREFKEFGRKNGVKHVTFAPYHLFSNSAAKRAVQTFKNSMTKTCQINNSTLFRMLLSTFIILLNSTHTYRKNTL